MFIFKSAMLFFFVLLSAAAAQKQTTVDPALLADIFGSPTPTAHPGPPRNEEIVIKPTESPANLVDQFGEQCQCVPYYLCDQNGNAVDAFNETVTGAWTLDIRFKEEGCQESAELCCKTPKTEEEAPPPPVPKKRSCGQRNPNGLDFSFTGGSGEEAQFGEFPWVVAVLAADGTYAGVGVLIHPEVVMTGAHIASKLSIGNLKVRAGEWDTQTIKERLKYEERAVKEMYIHKDFKPKSVQNDMALLRIDPIPLGDHINIICMPDQDENFDNYKGCIANGWGKDYFGVQGRYAVILKRVEINMVPHARCNTLLRRTRLGNNFKLHSSFVCAGGEEGKDTCQGDGGAPLACPIGNDQFKLTGLVAWGIGCGQKDVPAVYAAVPKFRQWVDDQMAEWGLTTDYSV